MQVTNVRTYKRGKREKKKKDIPEDEEMAQFKVTKIKMKTLDEHISEEENW